MCTPRLTLSLLWVFQKVELSELRSNHRQQLEEISSQLLLFEASLRGKEKALQDMLNKKDQVSGDG